MKTRARKVNDGYVLNGTKLWITNGSIADVAVVWAKEDDGEIYGFLVEKGTPGFSTLDIHGKFSMRASITSELAFQDCKIPAANKLPKVKGLRGPLGCLNQARYGIAWGAVGAAMAVYDWTLQYSQQRIQFGKPIGSFQLVQQKLVWMITEITKAQLLVLQLGRLKDAGTLRPQQVSMAKMNNVQMALDCARLGRDVLGAAGIVDEHPVIRHMLNLETVNTYEGTHDITRLDRWAGCYGAGRLRYGVAAPFYLKMGGPDMAPIPPLLLDERLDGAEFESRSQEVSGDPLHGGGIEAPEALASRRGASRRRFLPEGAVFGIFEISRHRVSRRLGAASRSWGVWGAMSGPPIFNQLSGGPHLQTISAKPRRCGSQSPSPRHLSCSPPRRCVRRLRWRRGCGRASRAAGRCRG